MDQLTSQADTDNGSRKSKTFRRHACDRCRSQKLRCDRTTHRRDTSIACDRCARNHFTCVTSDSMPMGRPRSLNPKPRYRRRTSKTSGDLGSKDTGTDSSTPPSCSTVQPSPNLIMAGMGMDAIDNLPELVFNQEDLGYGLGFPNGDVFDPTAFADLAMSSQPAAVGPTESAAANPQEQNVECLWKLHSTLLDHVYRIESQAINQIDPSKNESLPDTHPFGPQLSDVANTQSDHPMHQMMRCSQTFLEIIQSFVSSYRQSVCSIPPPDGAVTDCSRDSDDEYLRYPGNHGPASVLRPNTSFSSTVPSFDKSPATSPSTGLRGDQEENSSNNHPDKSPRRPRPALPLACQTQFPICLTIATCHVLLLRLHRSVLTDLYSAVQSLVARYSPAGNLTGPLAVLDNFAGSVPLSDVHLNGSALKLDGVQQVTTVLQLSCDLLERIDRGVEILLTGAGHILSAPGTYMSVLDALVQQEARSGRGPTLADGSGSTGGRAARLAPSRLLVQKIRRCINDTCL